MYAGAGRLASYWQPAWACCCLPCIQPGGGAGEKDATYDTVGMALAECVVGGADLLDHLVFCQNLARALCASRGRDRPARQAIIASCIPTRGGGEELLFGDQTSQHRAARRKQTT